MPFCTILGNERFTRLDVELAQFAFRASTFEKSFVVTLFFLRALRWGRYESGLGQLAEEVLRLLVRLHYCAIVENLFDSLCFRQVEEAVDLLDGVFVAVIARVSCCED